MLEILTITGPIYITIILGFVTTRLGLFARADMRVLGQFVINLALPALLFNALAQRKVGDILNGHYLLVYALGSLLAMGLGLLWARRGARQDATTSVYYATGMCCPHSGFVGYPIALLPAPAESAAGNGSRLHAVLRQSLLNLLRNPVVPGLLAGFAVSRLGTTIASFFRFGALLWIFKQVPVWGG